MKKTNNIGKKFIMIVLCLSMIFVTNTLAKEKTDKNNLELKSIPVEQVEITSVQNGKDKNIPDIKAVKVEYNQLVSSQYQPMFNKGLLISNKRNDRMLLRVKFEVPNIPTAILGFNKTDKYVEYLPYNYDDKSNILMVTVENNSIIIPLTDKLSKSESKKERRDIQPFSDTNFKILSNYNGIVNIDIDTLYHSGDSIYYKVYNDNIKVIDSTNLHDSNFSVEFSKRGIYRFEIYKKNNLWFDTKLWEQEVYVETNPLNTTIKNQLNTLARKYAPILTMSQKESFKPLKLKDIFSDSSYEIALNTKNGTKRLALPILKEYMRYNGYSKALLEGHWGLGTKSDSLESMSISSYEPCVYYSYAYTDSSYIINYHFFYNFDSKTKSTRESAHNFDREQISIVFNKSTMEPDYIYYPQHLIDTKMGILTDSGSSIHNILKNNNETLESTWEGYVKIPFLTAVNNNMVFNDTHIIIAIAEGSHAPYPLSGVYSYSNVREPAGLTKIDASCFLIPSNIYHEKSKDSQFDANNKYNLCLLSIDEINSGSNNPTATNLLSFSGYWVDIVGLNNVKFPPFIEIMRNLDGYVDESIKLDSHTFEMQNIPPSIIQRTKNIKDYLDSRL